jgi:hypothetical protein
VAQLAHVAGRAIDPDEVHSERERVGRHGQTNWQPVVSPRIRQEPVAPKVLDKGFGGAGVGDIDRGQQYPRHDLRTLREVVEALLLRGVESIAVVGDNRRIGTIELDLHRVVDETADRRNGVKDDREHIEADEGRERIE